VKVMPKSGPIGPREQRRPTATLGDYEERRRCVVESGRTACGAAGWGAGEDRPGNMDPVDRFARTSLRTKPPPMAFPSSLHTMTLAALIVLSQLLQRTVRFGADAPLGTSLEWMTIAAVVLPAVLLVVLVYVGQRDTV